MTVDKRIKDAIESINKKGEYIHKDVPSANVRFDEKFAPLDFYFLYQSYFFIAKAMYNALYIKEKEFFEHNLAQASTFAYLSIDTPSRFLCDCSQVKDSGRIYSFTMSEIVPLASVPMILGDFDKAKVVTQELADSLNAKSCIIQRGEYDALEAWFVVKLATNVFDIELDRRKPRYPNKEKFKDYQDVLDKWDSEDMLEVDKMTYFLAELHLLIDYEERITDLLVKPYFIQLFPYEILTWLKLRELKGLKNPKTFTHPLIKTPIAKMFLNIKEPLPYPQELPYAKELLEKLKEQCPDVEIPAWLGGEKN